MLRHLLRATLCCVCASGPAVAASLTPAYLSAESVQIDVSGQFIPGDPCRAFQLGEGCHVSLAGEFTVWAQYDPASAPVIVGTPQALPAVQDGSKFDLSWVFSPTPPEILPGNDQSPAPPEIRLFLSFGGNVLAPNSPPIAPTFAFLPNAIPPGPPAAPSLLAFDDLGGLTGQLVAFDAPIDVGSITATATAAAPEPATLILVATGIAGGVARRRARAGV